VEVSAKQGDLDGVVTHLDRFAHEFDEFKGAFEENGR
jgi:hypothetical protein